MDIIDIKGRELHFLRMALNWQQHQGCYTLDMLLNPPDHAQWSKEFIYNCEKKGFIKFEGDKIYVTDEAINAINEKDKIEGRFIEKLIIEDGIEYAFLTFMENRNEPVPILDMPGNFEFHSEIHMEPINGSETSFRTWDDQIHKYITAPNVDGYILNYTGKIKLAQLKKEKKDKEDKEQLELASINSSIRTSLLTRKNIRIGWGLGLATFLAVMANLVITIRKTNQDTERQKTESLKQEQNKSDMLQFLPPIQGIEFALKDTSKVKIKIVK